MAIPDETFTAGGPSVICAPISIIDDDIAENCVEMFGITVTSDGERVIDPTDMVVVQIIDDEGKYLFLLPTLSLPSSLSLPPSLLVRLS